MCVCVNCFLHEVFQFRSEPLCLSSVLLVSTSGMHVYTSSMHVFDVICGALLSCALRLALRLLPDAVNPTACHFITASNTPHGYTRVQSCRNFFSLQLHLIFCSVFMDYSWNANNKLLHLSFYNFLGFWSEDCTVDASNFQRRGSRKRNLKS